MAPAKRPARFSKATKASKPVAVATDVDAQQQCAQPTAHTQEYNRDASVEIVLTPSKKRKTTTLHSADADHVQDAQMEEDQSFITPTKASRDRVLGKINFMPTPPVTPTISVSEHAGRDDSLVSPTASTPSLCDTPSSSNASSNSCTSTPSTSSTNIYARARSLLRLSAPSSASTSTALIGRQAERDQLNTFLQCHFPSLYKPSIEDSIEKDTEEARSSASTMRRAKAMYISGSPGTGKTALLDDVIQSFKRNGGLSRTSSVQAVSIAVLNCTTVQRPDDVWGRLAEELSLSMPVSARGAKGKAKAKWTMEAFKEAVAEPSDSSKCLVVLDEIDHLLPEAPSTSSASSIASTNVLAALFAMALSPTSNLVLIGIANALDLTQRYRHLLFGLQQREEEEEDDDNGEEMPCQEANRPELLHFRPFQSDEMVAIVKQRLQALHTSENLEILAQEGNSSTPIPLPVVMPAALELAAKKVAAVTGDLRAFLSLIRKAVEIFETEQRKRLNDLEEKKTGSWSTAPGPVSPTKNMLANRHKKRKMNAEGGVGADAESLIYVDALSQFDAKTAPKLTPAHILKATRLVSLTSSSSANSRSGNTSQGSGINSSSGALSTTSSSSSSLLQSKTTELNLQQRLALTSFLILLARRISAKVPSWSMGGSEQNTVIDVDAEASSIPQGGARASELHALYKALLEKEDLIHPVASSEFSDLLSGLHTRGLVGYEKEVCQFTLSNTSNTTRSVSSSATTLAPPMMRRSSSSSSISSMNGGSSPSSNRSSRSPSPNAARSGAQAPLYLLYPYTLLQSVLSTPASASSSSAAIKQTEASVICSNLLGRESKRLKRIQKNNEQLDIQRKERELAPRAGFNGDGLDHAPSSSSVASRNGGSYVGKRDRRGRDGDEEDLEVEEEDHEKKDDKKNEEQDD